MKLEQSKTGRRVAVSINYGSVVLILGLFAYGSYNGWNSLLSAGMVIATAILLVSFLRLHLRTRLWQLVHTRVEDLDERQTQITHESLRLSYSIFSVVVLCLLFYLGLKNTEDSMLMLTFAVLLYLAHTLPSSVLAWREREV